MLITNHAKVLYELAMRGGSTYREIAQYTGITERSVMSIVNDLVQAGHIAKTRNGRKNIHTILLPKRVMGSIAVLMDADAKRINNGGE